MGYSLADDAQGKHVLAELASRFSTRSERRPGDRTVYLDTFDWRLFDEGLELSARVVNGTSVLTLASDDKSVNASIPSSSLPGFAAELPDGRMHDLVAPLIDVRRLLPLAEVETRSHGVRILDDQEKTVARVQLVSARAADPGHEDAPEALSPRLAVIPVKGYPSALRRVTSFLEGDLGLERVSPAIYDEALRSIGREPGSYSSKLDLHLDPNVSADETVIRICRHLLDSMVANEDGVRRDLDSEFLHDFRVACRRTRSALTQLKKEFPEEVRDHFREEFKWLGSVTGPVRDLDVHLLQMDDYRDRLGEDARESLAPLGEFLRRHRSADRRRLLGALRSKRYERLVADWRAYLDAPADERAATEEGHRLIIDVASERIWHTYRKVIKRARAITPHSPDQALHDVRIDCKKLRYLLEFFSSLYASHEIKPLVKALKQLQDNLGDFNDLVVQQDAMRRFAREMEEEGLATIECTLTMGRLVEHYVRRQHKERRRFAQCFARFDDADNRHRFHRLFAKGAGGRS